MQTTYIQTINGENIPFGMFQPEEINILCERKEGE